MVTVFSPELLNNSLDLALRLRLNNINTELYPEPVKLDKQLKYADAKGIPYVAIIGPEEIASNTVKLKNMSTGEQKCLPEQELISLF